MSKAKSKDWILETIDQLRKRKARPDLERICHMVERKHGLSFEEIVADLDVLVEEEIVIKVDYKGSTSYRNAAKWKKSHLGGQILNSNDIGRRIQSIVTAICEDGAGAETIKTNQGERSPGSGYSMIDMGASAQDIEEWLFQNDPEFVSSKINLHTLLEREVQVKHLELLPNGNYVVADVLPETPSKPPPVQNDLSPSTSGSSVSAPASVTKTSPGKKGRPPTKRKKIKKSLGPDFEHYSVVKKKRGKNRAPTPVETPGEPEPNLYPEPALMSEEPRCDYCLQTSASNRKGAPEDLLICKDCQAKAHPSCMDYSESLAKRARNSPWQCIDCKTCYVCQDAGDPDAMLFCDACDKGYHMSCHNPPVEDKPTGKWVCSKCIMELGLDENEINMDTDETDSRVDARVDYNHDNGDGGASCLPTPSDSPVHFQDEPLSHKDSIKMNGNITTPIPKLAVTLKLEVPDASDWSIDDVVEYFDGVGFQEQAEVFREQEIDGKSLLLMKRSDVLTGLSLRLGPALKIYAHVQRLQTRGQNFF